LIKLESSLIIVNGLLFEIPLNERNWQNSANCWTPREKDFANENDLSGWLIVWMGFHCVSRNFC